MSGLVGNTGLSRDRLARITASMEGYVERGEVAGVVTLVHRRGETAHVDVVGWQDDAERVPLRRDSLFRIASMTKPIVSVATMMLVEQGRLRLSDPIGRWLPELASPRVLRRPDAPLDETYAAPQPITVRDLLIHRAGISYPITAEGPLVKALREINEDVFPKSIPTDEWLKRMGELPLSYAPGQRWHYGLATDVLGLLLGRVMGMSFPDVLRTLIFEPLGMQDTAFWVPDAKADRLGPAYFKAPNADKRVVVDHPSTSRWRDTASFPSGGAGLTSTVDDYLKFARMMQRYGEVDGVRLLSRKSVELMATNHLTPEERRTPFLGQDFWSGQGFGLGLSMVDDIARYEAYASPGRFGWPGAYGTFWCADPREDLVLLMMIQLYFGKECKVGLDFQTLAYQAIAD